MEPASHTETIQIVAIASAKAQATQSLAHLMTRKEGIVGAL